MKKKKVNMAPIKEFVNSELPPSSMLRRIIVQEKDSISAKSFLVEMRVWLKMAREEEHD